MTHTDCAAHRERGLATRLGHGGEAHHAKNAVALPIFESAAFTMDNWEHHEESYGSPSGGVYYSRGYNPTVQAFEEKVASIEGGARTLGFNAGMAAISTSILEICKGGGHLIVSDKVFATSDLFFRNYLTVLGASMSYVDFADLDAMEAAITPQTRAIFFEEITNPLLHTLDLDSLIELAHRNEILAVVDNSFAPPVLLRPLEHGADLVIHSATKYMSGHGRVLGGVVTGNDLDLMARIAELRRENGSIITPHNAGAIQQGLVTLQIRVERASENAAALTDLAVAHRATTSVNYPGLASTPGHERAREFMKGTYGGVFSFSVDNLEKKAAVYNAFELITRSTSFGDAITLVDAVPDPDVLRISAGIEEIGDLASDLEHALNAAL